MQTQQEERVAGRATERPAIYKVEQYARKTGLLYYQKMPGVKSVKAYQGRFGFGSTGHDIEIWLELEDMESLDTWEEYVISHQEEILGS